MGREELLLGLQAGSGFGDAVAQGVAEWKQLQRDRQEREAFNGAMGMAAQRRAMIKSAAGVEDAALIQQLESQLRRYPNAQQGVRQTGNVGKDGTPETEQIVTTPEGEISLAQLDMLKARKRQAESNAELAEVDLILELQARYPENRYIRQWVASSYLAIQQKGQIRARQIEQEGAQLEAMKAALAREQFEQEKLKYREAPERQERAAATENALGMQRDASRIELQKRADLEIEGKKAEGKPTGPDFKNVMDLRKEYDSQAKGFVTVRDAKRQIDALSAQPQTSTNDLALLYSYIKLLDPESVVREGEVTLSQAGSVPQQLLTEAKRLFTEDGALLGPKIRQEIVSNSGTVFGERAKGQQALEQRYTSLSQRAGADPQDVVESYLEQGQSSAPPAAAGTITPEQARAELERRRAGRAR